LFFTGFSNVIVVIVVVVPAPPRRPAPLLLFDLLPQRLSDFDGQFVLLGGNASRIALAHPADVLEGVVDGTLVVGRVWRRRRHRRRRHPSGRRRSRRRRVIVGIIVLLDVRLHLLHGLYEEIDLIHPPGVALGQCPQAIVGRRQEGVGQPEDLGDVAAGTDQICDGRSPRLNFLDALTVFVGLLDGAVAGEAGASSSASAALVAPSSCHGVLGFEMR